MDKITDTYLNDIILEAHGRPIFGWNAKSFEKGLLKMIRKKIRKKAIDEFDEQFCSTKIYDFDEIFKSVPVIELDGEGTNIFIKLTYTSDKLSKEDTERLLCGIKNSGDDGTYSERGILFNPHFRNKLGISNTAPEKELEEPEDPESPEVSEDEEEEEVFENVNNKSTFNDIYYNLINEGFFRNLKNSIKNKFSKNKNVKPPFNEVEAKKWCEGGCTISVIFEFDQTEYCKNFKKKERFNLNRLCGMTGQVFLSFNKGGGSEADKPIKVTNDGGLKWKQKRTENMDPPKPLKQEIKEIWNNPNEGYGLLGLAMGTGDVIQEEEFDINFNDNYSQKNMDTVKSETKKVADKDRRDLNDDAIEGMLNSDSVVDWTVEEMDDDRYECEASLNGESILKFTIELG